MWLLRIVWGWSVIAIESEGPRGRSLRPGKVEVCWRRISQWKRTGQGKSAVCNTYVREISRGCV